MLKRSHYISLGLVAVLALVVLNLPARTSARLKLAIGSLFLPLLGLVGVSQQATVKAADAITTRAELETQNEALRRENQQLRVQGLPAAELARENERLRQLLRWQQQRPQWKLKLAHVLLRDPANWWRTVRIDLGSRDGLRENMPVLTMEGLVGRVQAVAHADATVVLLGDPKCSVAARVENETRDAGVLGTSGPFDASLVDLSFLPRSSLLKAGQNVVTSGEGGIFPKGIPIGRVMDWQPAEFGLYTQARVKLNANLASLEELWVMVQ